MNDIIEIHGIKMPDMSDDMLIKHFRENGNEFEPETLSIWQNHTARNTGIVFDCGCYTGLFSFVACKANPNSVIRGYDVNMNTICRAEKIARINFGIRPKAIKFNQAAVLSQDGYAKYEFGFPMSSAGKVTNRDGGIPVESVSLDSEWHRMQPEFPQHRVIAIKMDLEGAELLALRGATKIIATYRPLIIAEANTPECVKNIREFLHTFGYQNIRLVDGRNLITIA